MVYKISSNSFSNNAITTDKINDDAVTSDKIEDSFLQGVIPIGGIIMFTGSTAPAGYVFCDDSAEAQAASAPDLRDKFVVGFTPFSNSTSYPNLQLGASGGSPNAVLVAHDHGVSNDSHTHTDTFSINNTKNFAYRVDGGSSATDTIDGEDDPGNMGYKTPTIAGSVTANATGITIDDRGKNTSGVNSDTQTHENANLPPYYALAFIMRIS